jgi:hypothetical protein
MKALFEDTLISMGLAVLIVMLVLFSSFHSTFIYRGF